jgi:anhydro-N-acetylmuramic acid kinase
LALAATAKPQDVQATLTELTAWSCAQALQVHGEAPVKRLLVCGGGALNSELMRRLQTHLPHTAVVSTETAGLPPLQVEAVAFAWLARQTWLGRSSNLPAVTGAQGPRVLGAIYPA